MYTECIFKTFNGQQNPMFNCFLLQSNNHLEIIYTT